jgi:hypothetical protein
MLTTKKRKNLLSAAVILPLILILALPCWIAFNAKLRYGEDARPLINRKIFATLPASASKLYYFKHSDVIDSFYYIGLTLPPSEGMEFMEDLFGSAWIEEGNMQHWLDLDMGPQRYGLWQRTPLWNPGRMKDPVHAGRGGTMGVYDRESGRLLIHIARI